MTEAYSTELYRQEGAEFRSVRVAVNADGSIRLDAQDMGKSVEKWWSDDDSAPLHGMAPSRPKPVRWGWPWP